MTLREQMARMSNDDLLAFYEEEIDRSGCFPYQDDRAEWTESGWHVFEIRDEIMHRAAQGGRT